MAYKPLLVFHLLQIAATASSTPGTVCLPIYKDVHLRELNLSKRQTEERIFIPDYDTTYYVTAEVGTPGQSIKFLLDTGSADTYVALPGACTLSDSCSKSYFDPSKSSTYMLSSVDTFSTTYEQPGSLVVGNFIQESVRLGNITLQHMTMGLAKRTIAVPEAVLGIAPRDMESTALKTGKPYPNIIDELFRQGVTKSRKFSLYMNDDTREGRIIFGGIDAGKFVPPLRPVPASSVPTPNGLGQTGIDLALHSVTIGSKNGSTTEIGMLTQTALGTVPVALAALDSGTNHMVLPPNVFDPIIIQTNASWADPAQSSRYMPSCSCSKVDLDYLDLRFANSTGPVIRVSFNHLIIDEDRENDRCFLRIGSTLAKGSDSPSRIFLGDSFMSSAYVLFDYDTKTISLAQAKFDSSSSNVVPLE